MHRRTAILTGTTASGKTALALEFARADRSIEIINADSLLVYRFMNIGTAKPTQAELAEIPHHLIDIRDPVEPFTAGDFYRIALRAIDEIHSREKKALIVGGTGFYLKSLLYGLWEAPKADPLLRARLAALGDMELYARLEARDTASALRIGRNDHYRLIRANEIMELTGSTPSELEARAPSEADPRFELLVVDRENEELFKRIALRTDAMLKEGLITEVQDLLARFPEARALQSVGYAETRAYLEGRKPAGRKLAPGEAGLRAEIGLATRQLVKRQRTWFKGQTDAKPYLLDRDREQALARLKELYEAE